MLYFTYPKLKYSDNPTKYDMFAQKPNNIHGSQQLGMRCPWLTVPIQRINENTTYKTNFMHRKQQKQQNGN